MKLEILVKKMSKVGARKKRKFFARPVGQSQGSLIAGLASPTVQD
jgi:hypothetical protein